MRNALGLCQHNNMGTSCPTCIRSKARGFRAMGANFSEDSEAEGLEDQDNSYSSSMNGSDFAGMGIIPRGMGVIPRGMRGMGAEACQPGFYRLKVFGIDTGQCLPSLSTATSAAQSGVLSSVGTGIATSPSNVIAAQNAATQTVATKTIQYIKDHPVMIAGVVGVVGLLAFYGGGKALFGRR